MNDNETEAGQVSGFDETPPTMESVTSPPEKESMSSVIEWLKGELHESLHGEVDQKAWDHHGLLAFLEAHLPPASLRRVQAASDVEL